MERTVVTVLIFAVLAVALVWAVAGALAKPSVDWHQRLTLTLDTPRGPITAQATQSKHMTFGKQFLTDMSSTERLRGEAVVADLGDGRHVFALLETASVLLASAYHAQRRSAGNGTAEEQMRHIAQSPEPLPLTGRLLPLMVTFDDPTRPETIRIVTPDTFAEVFGKGYGFRGATIQTTTDPVTRGRVATALPWITELDTATQLKSTHPSVGKRSFIKD